MVTVIVAGNESDQQSAGLSKSNFQCEAPPLRDGVAVDLWGLGEPLPGVGYRWVEPYPLRA